MTNKRLTIFYLFFNAKLWNWASLGRALGAEDLATGSAVMLAGH